MQSIKRLGQAISNKQTATKKKTKKKQGYQKITEEVRLHQRGG